MSAGARIVVVTWALGAASFASATLAASASARAQEGGDADSLIERGLELREARRDGDALPYFRRAYEISPTPRATAQLGLVEQALSMWVDAEAHLQRALAEARDPWIEHHGAALARAHAFVEARLGSIFVTGTPSGARVRIDERDVGALPLPAPILVAPGPHAIAIEARGYDPEHRDVHVAAGVTVEERVALAPEGQSVASLSRAEDDLSPWLWATSGAGLVSALLSLYFLLDANGTYGDLEITCGATPMGCSDAEIDGSGLYTSIALTYVFMGVAVGFLGAAIGIYVLDRDAAEERRATLRARAAAPEGAQ